MTYAIVRTGGKQYRVAPGEVFEVERLAGDIGARVTLTDICFVAGDSGPRAGTPTVTGAAVTCEIVAQGRARKIIVFKSKRKDRYHRKHGHRQEFTRLKVLDIAGAA